MTTQGCEHFQLFKKDRSNMDSLRWLHAVFVVGTNFRYRQTKVVNAYCRTCQNRGPFIHACLECVYFGCHKHIREHTTEEQHNFSTDLIYGQLYCQSCGDYVYDSVLDKINFKNRMKCDYFKKRLFECMSWEPTEEEKELLSSQIKKICITPESTIGLRGLTNLGATCFMNSVVQVLMHTPFLREYFLSESHSCRGSASSCLVCIVSKLFQEFYNGDKVPLVLNNFLYLIWTHASHLCGYKQHDVHEFFITTLDVLHKNFSTLLGNPDHPNSIGNCSCIIHQIFTGVLQSDLVCQTCNGVSVTIEPTWDFPLSLVPTSNGGKPPVTLIDCLEIFTKTEHLGTEVMCETCGSKQELTKQFTIKTLPVVICFYLKRFGHPEKAENKISIPISFPEMLDMTPFMSKREKDTAFPSDNRYSLFAVINHIGKSINSGHYTVFVRKQHDYWYRCNDNIITRANLAEVLDSKGYMLFYHKHVLGYD